MIGVKKYKYENLLILDDAAAQQHDVEDQNPFEVSNSSISLFRSCRFQWFLRYVLGLKHVLTPAYFDDGDIFHCGLELHYNGESAATVKAYVRERYQKLLGESLMRSPKIVDAMETRTVTLQGMLEGYQSVYKDDLKNWNIIFAEREFGIEMLDSEDKPFMYRGKIDMKIQEKKTKKYYIVEHKTASQIGVQYVSKLPMDTQVLTYLAMDSENVKNNPDWNGGGIAEGCIYNVIKKPGIRVKNGETRQAYLKRLSAEYTDPKNYNKYYYRDKIEHKKSRLIKFIKEIKDIVPEMRMVAFEMLSAHKNGQACDDYGGCSYKDICLKGGLKGTHMAYYEVDANLHPELSRR